MVADDDDGSCLDFTTKNKTPEKKLDPNGFWVDPETPSKKSSDLVVETEPPENKFRCLFDQFLGSFLKEICGQDCFWPLPPMLGNGQSVNLFKLFLVVRENGGCDAVSENGLWDLVAKESGLGLNFTSAVKLVYIKYLDALERWLERVVVVVEDKESKSKAMSDSGENLGGFLMGLEEEFRGFLSRIPNSKKKSSNGEYSRSDSRREELSFSDDGSLGKINAGVVGVGDEESMHIDSKKSVGEFKEVGRSSNGDGVKRVVVDLSGDEDVEEIPCLDLGKSVVNLSDIDDEVKSVGMELDGGKKCSDSDEDVMILESVFKEEVSSRKRKRESLWGMLNWLTEIAKNPCDPAVGVLPERSKWKSHGNEELWKQVLLYREAMFPKIHADSSVEQSTSQKNQKMHPCMYDDHVGSSYNLRERLRCGKKLLFGKTTSQGQAYSSSSGTQSDLDKILSPYRAGMGRFLDSSNTDSEDDEDEDEDGVPLGSKYQAEVPEWTGVVTESDSKWLGTRVWPLDRSEHRSLIERDRIGKGGQDSCGCAVQDSVECVRFHVAEKRFKVKLELGSAFNRWNFNKMGEEVKRFWTKEEEKKFKDTKNLTSTSQERGFWHQIFEDLPTKSREDLVSYYFNVFLLERRACQNRMTPSKIEESDEESDEESESRLVTNGPRHKAIKSPRSLLRSPSKPYKKF